jgi:hypothetical protein
MNFAIMNGARCSETRKVSMNEWVEKKKIKRPNGRKELRQMSVIVRNGPTDSHIGSGNWSAIAAAGYSYMGVALTTVPIIMSAMREKRQHLTVAIVREVLHTSAMCQRPVKPWQPTYCSQHGA